MSHAPVGCPTLISVGRCHNTQSRLSLLYFVFSQQAEDLTRKGGNLYGLGFARSHDGRATRELLGTRGDIRSMHIKIYLFLSTC